MKLWGGLLLCSPLPFSCPCLPLPPSPRATSHTPPPLLHPISSSPLTLVSPDVSIGQSNWFIWPTPPISAAAKMPNRHIFPESSQTLPPTRAPSLAPALSHFGTLVWQKTIPPPVGFVSCWPRTRPFDRAKTAKYCCRGWGSSFTDELRAALPRHLVLIKIIFFLSVFLSRLKKRFERNRILEWVPNKFPFPKGQVFSKASSGNLQQFIKKRQLYLWPISCIIWMSSEVLESSLFLKCLEALQHIWCLTNIPKHTNLFNFHSATSAFWI